SGLLSDGDEHGRAGTVSFDLDGVDGDGACGGQARGLARAQVEGGAVEPALDLAVLHLALGERDVRVRAGVADRVDLALGTDDGHRGAVHLDTLGRVLLQLAEGADLLERRGSGHAMDASSSASSFASSRSSTSGTPICWTSSAKKPRTTRRRASSAGTPRDIR